MWYREVDRVGSLAISQACRQLIESKASFEELCLLRCRIYEPTLRFLSSTDTGGRLRPASAQFLVSFQGELSFDTDQALLNFRDAILGEAQPYLRLKLQDVPVPFGGRVEHVQAFGTIFGPRSTLVELTVDDDNDDSQAEVGATTVLGTILGALPSNSSLQRLCINPLPTRYETDIVLSIPKMSVLRELWIRFDRFPSQQTTTGLLDAFRSNNSIVSVELYVLNANEERVDVLNETRLRAYGARNRNMVLIDSDEKGTGDSATTTGDTRHKSIPVAAWPRIFQIARDAHEDTIFRRLKTLKDITWGPQQTKSAKSDQGTARTTRSDGFGCSPIAWLSLSRRSLLPAFRLRMHEVLLLLDVLRNSTYCT